MSARVVARRRRWLFAAVAAIVGIAVAIALLSAGSGGSHGALPPPGTARVARSGDPFAWVSGRDSAFVARATAGSSHVLYTKSPGGVLATAARVAAFRPLIDAAVRGSGVDPNVLEGIVFVESAGRPYVLAGADVTAAAGLTQILADTGRSLLGMHIDIARSRKLLAQAGNASSSAQLSATLRRLARVDTRFDPRRALAATVRYLQLAGQRFGRSDLAVVSYHMGIGNLDHVLTAYDGGRAVPYAQLYFDTAPDRHATAYALLSGFGDQSSLYLWRVLGATGVMQLYRRDPGALTRLAQLQTARDSTAAVLHPPEQTKTFADSAALASAYSRGSLVPLPRNPGQVGLGYSRELGAGAQRLGVEPALYRGLRPAALELLVELGARVRTLTSDPRAVLILAGAVADGRYQRSLGVEDPDARTGYTFSIERRYASRRQAVAFQATLDRLQALNLIAWTRSPTKIEVTVASDASQVIRNGP
ncbi:MAG: transglycosylase SLT domain-containing protein [Solirubrobacterales bacterium]|nr:transglycosylase SLT domain-containing protein [Solirubrobacterales bacterium]